MGIVEKKMETTSFVWRGSVANLRLMHVVRKNFIWTPSPCLEQKHMETFGANTQSVLA